jgi:hypothetical protein
MNRRLVTGLVAVLTTCGLGILVACGGGEHPSAASDDPLFLDAGKKDGASGSGVLFDIDLEKGIVFGDNGLVSCGTQAADRTITLKNTSDDIVNYAVSITDGNDRYTVTPTDGGIPAGASATLKITPKAIPAASDVSPDLYAGSLEVKFPQLGVPPTTIRLHQTARGAIITSSIGDQLNLGSVKVGEANEVPLILTNSGNVEATASFKLGTDVFTIDGASQATVQVAAGGSESKKLKLAPVAAGDLSDTLAITYNSSAVFCKPPPAQIALTGKGTTSVGISKGSIDFGLVNCGSTADPQTVDITSTVAMKFTAVLTKGALSPYTLANDSDGSTVHPDDQNQIAQASTFKLRVVPKAMAQVSSTADNAFGDTLTITTDVPGDTPHVISLKEGAKGAILAFDLTTNNVSGPVGGQVQTPFKLLNNGNLTVPYKITASPAPDPSLGGFTSTLTTGTATIGSTAGVLISQAPTSKGSITNGTLKVELGAGGGVLCADLPPPVPLSVTGTGTAITINPTLLNYGTIICGSQAQAQFFTLSATVDNNIKLSLGQGPSSAFSFSNDEAGTDPIANNSLVAVTAGNPRTIWVQAKVISIPTKPGALDDLLTLTSDIATEDPRTMPLKMTASGYYYTLPASVVEGSQIAIQNSGSLAGKINVTGPVTTTGDFDLAAGATLTLTTTGPGTVTITPKSGTSNCVGTGTVTVTAKPTQ